MIEFSIPNKNDTKIAKFKYDTEKRNKVEYQGQTIYYPGPVALMQVANDIFNGNFEK